MHGLVILKPGELSEFGKRISPSSAHIKHALCEGERSLILQPRFATNLCGLLLVRFGARGSHQVEAFGHWIVLMEIQSRRRAAAKLFPTLVVLETWVRSHLDRALTHLQECLTLLWSAWSAQFTTHKWQILGIGHVHVVVHVVPSKAFHRQFHHITEACWCVHVDQNCGFYIAPESLPVKTLDLGSGEGPVEFLFRDVQSHLCPWDVQARDIGSVPTLVQEIWQDFGLRYGLPPLRQGLPVGLSSTKKGTTSNRFKSCSKMVAKPEHPILFQSVSLKK